MQPRIVIVAYKPKPGKEKGLAALMRTHLPTLQKEGLVTDRPSIIAQAKDGTFIEVFEWKSAEAIEQAHTNAAVNKMWQAYAEVCDYIPTGQVSEFLNVFSEFSPFI
ncbi:hypothetical protein ACI6Q2_05790 [Chitinophagaceae bacterium LWZ2-11]